MTVPSWWQFALLALAAFRVTRLVGWDDLTIPLRSRLTRMGDEQHKQWAYVIDSQREVGYDPWTPAPPRRVETEAEGHALNVHTLSERLRAATGSPTVPPIPSFEGYVEPPVSPRRYYLSKMLRCPWCAGFWISLAFAVAWGGASDAWLSGVLLAFPLSATVGLIAKRLDP